VVAEASSPKKAKKSNIGLIVGLVFATLLMAEGYYFGITGLRKFNTIIAEKAFTDYLEESVTWRLMEDKGGNFKMRFPGNPEKDIQSKEIAGETVRYVTYSMEAHPDILGNSFFGITYSRVPAKIVESYKENPYLFFDDYFRSRANSMRGLIKESFVNDYNENPGMAAIISLDEGEFEWVNWSFTVGNTQYLLEVACPIQNTKNEKIDKFFLSFELLEIE
jgi:hypothetical protein